MNPERFVTLRTFKTSPIAMILIAMLLIAALQIAPAYALGSNIKSTAAGGDWNLGTTWAGGVVPSAADTVTIANGATVTVTTDATAANLNFDTTTDSGATVNIDPGITLTITNAVTIPRGLTASTNTLAVGAGSLNAGRISFTGTGAGGHQVTISTGTATVSGNVVGLSSGTATITFTDAGTLKVGGDMFTAATGILTTFAGSTVEYNGNGPQPLVGNFAYSNLTFAGSGAKNFPTTATVGGNLTLAGTASSTASGKKTIGGNLMIGAGAELDTSTSNTATLAVMGATTVGGTLKLYNTANKTFTGDVVVNSGGVWNEQAAAAINFAGSLQNDGTFTANTGLHTFSGLGQTVGGANPLVIPNLKIMGTITNNGTLTVSTGLTGTGSLTNGATGVLNFGGPFIAPTLDASAAGNVVSYNGAGQTVYATAYDLLVLRGSGVKSIPPGTAVATNLSIAPSGSAVAGIAAGQTIPAASLLLGGVNQVSGTWGGAGSGAAHINTTYFAATSGKLSVSGLSVDVTANPQSKTYGDPDPVLTYGSSNPSVVFTGSLSRASGEHVGTYPISIGTLSAGYYSIHFTSADLTINQKALTQGTADDKSIAPGAADPIFTVTYSGLVNGDTFASIDTPPTCGVSVAHSTPGNYPITCTDGSGSDTDYDLSGVTYTAGTLHVTDAVFASNPTSWDFGVIKVGSSSVGEEFLILNTGASTMTINAVALAGTNPDQFQLTDDCTGNNVPGHSYCTVTVTFSPTSAGSKSAAIQIGDTAPGTPHSIPVSGKAATEVAVNGGFEQYPTTTAKVPAGWAAANFSAKDGKNMLFAEEGIASIRISNSFAIVKSLRQTRSLSGAAGSTFQLSLWTKGNNIPASGGAARVVVRLFKGTTLVQTRVLPLPTGTYDFMPSTLTFTATKGYSKVLIQLVYSKPSGAIWFDGLSLLRAP